MASCKDCIHRNVCREYVEELAAARGFKIENLLELKLIMQADDCEHYADLSRLVELPYPLKVGDTVWFILDNLDDLSLADHDFTVGRRAVGNGDTVTEVGLSGFWYRAVLRDERENLFEPSADDFVRWEEIGKTVFLTREEAEQALKGTAE